VEVDAIRTRTLLDKAIALGRECRSMSV